MNRPGNCALIHYVTSITEAEFRRICNEIRIDRDKIVAANPIGTPEETLLWMLLGVLVSYLSLDDAQAPCFNGKPDAETYRNAILFVLRGRMQPDFDAAPYLRRMTGE